MFYAGILVVGYIEQRFVDCRTVRNNAKQNSVLF